MQREQHYHHHQQHKNEQQQQQQPSSNWQLQHAGASLSARLRALSSREVCSSLFLQQLLHYQGVLSAAWIVTVGVRIYLKYGRGLQLADPDIARTILCAFWLLAEPVRLAAGFYGNLQENVPWLVIFGVLTLVPQTAVAYYLLLAAYDLAPFDKALQVPMVITTHLQLGAAVAAVLRMFAAQRRAFYTFEHYLEYAAQEQGGAVAVAPLTRRGAAQASS